MLYDYDYAGNIRMITCKGTRTRLAYQMQQHRNIHKLLAQFCLNNVVLYSIVDFSGIIKVEIGNVKLVKA